MKTYQEYLNEQNILQRGLDYVKSKLGMKGNQTQQYTRLTNETINKLKDVVLNITNLVNNAGRDGNGWQKGMEPRIEEIRRYMLHVLNSLNKIPPIR